MSRPASTPFFSASRTTLALSFSILRNAIWVAFGRPLFLGEASGELGGVLEDEHKSYKVDVCEHLRDGWAALHRPGLQPALRQRAKQVDQDGVVPVPGIQQSLKQALVCCVRHMHTDSVFDDRPNPSPGHKRDSIPAVNRSNSR